jgi:hypothetical protein
MEIGYGCDHGSCSAIWLSLPVTECSIDGSPIDAESGLCLLGCQPADRAAYEAYMEAEAARGPLAGCPHEMECWECGREALRAGTPYETDEHGYAYVTRAVTALGPVAEAHRDPTSTYRLACGHVGM